MHQIQFRLGLCDLAAPPDPLAGFWKKREGQEKRKESRKEEMKGQGRVKLGEKGSKRV